MVSHVIVIDIPRDPAAKDRKVSQPHVYLNLWSTITCDNMHLQSTLYTAYTSISTHTVYLKYTSIPATSPWQQSLAV